MIINYKTIVLLISILLLDTNFAEAQKSKLSLTDAIELAKNNSYEYKAALNRFHSGKWNYENYRISFLPTLYLDGTLPNYNRSINRITLPNGEDIFISQNQAFSSLNLGIRQNIAVTGGTLEVGSSLNRIDVFGNVRQTNYSSAPVSISYHQNAIGYNIYKWKKKIEPLRFESAKRELASNIEQISLQTVNNYFNLIASETQTRLSKQNLATLDTLYHIAQERYKLGTVDQSELLKLRLNFLNNENKVREDSIDFVIAKQDFSRYLLLEDHDQVLEIPENMSFFDITFDEAVVKARENSKAVIDFRLRRLEAEQSLAATKSDSKLKFNIRANFGLSGIGNNIPILLNKLENQQNVALTFSIPLIDWGFNKTQKLRSEANLMMVKSDIESQKMQLEQEVSYHISRWNLNRLKIITALETRKIAQENFNIELRRYKLGSISVLELNQAQLQKDDAAKNYVKSVREYWELFYLIRKLTLFDFENKKNIILDVAD